MTIRESSSRRNFWKDKPASADTAQWEPVKMYSNWVFQKFTAELVYTKDKILLSNEEKKRNNDARVCIRDVYLLG